jgi:DNA polymerase sigma
MAGLTQTELRVIGDGRLSGIIGVDSFEKFDLDDLKSFKLDLQSAQKELTHLLATKQVVGQEASEVSKVLVKQVVVIAQIDSELNRRMSAVDYLNRHMVSAQIDKK